MSRLRSGDLFTPRASGPRPGAAGKASRRAELNAALGALPPLDHDPAPWSLSRGRAGASSVNCGPDAAASKLRFEDQGAARRNAPVASAAPTLLNLTMELLYALVDAPRDDVVEETLGIACDTLAALHHHSTPGGADAARALRRAAGVRPEPRSEAEGGPRWFEGDA